MEFSTWQSKLSSELTKKCWLAVVHVNVVKNCSKTPAVWAFQYWVNLFSTCPSTHSKRTQSASVIIAGPAQWPEHTDSPRWQIHCFIMMHYKEKHFWSCINLLCASASFRVTPSKNVFHSQFIPQWSIFKVLITYFPFYSRRPGRFLNFITSPSTCFARAANETAGAESNEAVLQSQKQGMSDGHRIE